MLRVKSFEQPKATFKLVCFLNVIKQQNKKGMKHNTRMVIY